MTNLKEYILDNHKTMTAAEMAKERGIDVKHIHQAFHHTGLKPVSPADRIRGFIKENPSMTAKEIAGVMNRKPDVIKVYARELGIVLPGMGQVGRQRADPKDRDWISIEDVDKVDEELESFEWREEVKQTLLDIGLFQPTPKPRLREAYNQSGSPYGIADEIRNVKIK